jgi:hypothetical protein
VGAVIGTSTQYKSLSLAHDDFTFDFKFIDLKMFFLSGFLDENARFMDKDIC